MLLAAGAVAAMALVWLLVPIAPDAAAEPSTP
jgi:hypothetical protein